MTDQLDLDAIATVIAAYQQHPDLGFACCSAHLAADAATAMAAEIRRLRARVVELEGTRAPRCGRTRDFNGIEQGACTRNASHWDPYCRSEDGTQFIAIAADQPAAVEAHVVADDSDTPDTLPAWLAQRFDPQGASRSGSRRSETPPPTTPRRTR